MYKIFIYLITNLFIYHKKLAHAVMETEKSQDLQGESASCRPRKDDGVVPVWVQRPENQEY